MKGRFSVRARCAALLGAIWIAALISPAMAAAQGCSQCRDATAGSAPQARRALRIAIPLLGISALCIFAGAFMVARKIPPGPDQRK